MVPVKDYDVFCAWAQRGRETLLQAATLNTVPARTCFLQRVWLVCRWLVWLQC